MRHLIACTTMLAVLTPAVAHADVSLDASEVRSYDLPQGFDPGQAQVRSTRDGTTLIFETTGQGDQAACTVVLAGDAGATAYDYRYKDGPTACVGVIAHPDGGFFVRGAKADAQAGDVSGFTARLGADGTEMWVVDDQDLVDARSEADGGTGEFLGQYVEPHPQMAYSKRFDKLLAFTNGNLNVGGGQQLTQAHVIAADTGRLMVSGLTFGQTGSAGFLAQTVTRTSDGYFLLYIYSAGSKGAYFFSYNGRSSIDAFKPMGEDWSTRYVRQMVYGPDDHVYLLWTPSDQPDAPTNVTVVDDQAQQVWSSSYEASVSLPGTDQPTQLGAPMGMWVGMNYALVLYNANQQLVLRVVDVATGQALGVAPLEGVTAYTPMAILNGADGGLDLLAVDTDAGKLHEFRLDISASGDTGGDGDAGGDAALSDAGASGGGNSAGGGCSTGRGAHPAGLWAVMLALGLLAIGRAVPTIAPRTGGDV